MSLYCLGEDSKLRRLCISIMLNHWFDIVILICIIVNSILLATKDYTDLINPSYESEWNEKLEMIDIGFTVVFVIECAIKIIAMGFAMHKHSYMRDFWNVLDFLIVIISIVGYLPFIP